jgi:hypothetical protein
MKGKWAELDCLAPADAATKSGRQRRVCPLSAKTKASPAVCRICGYTFYAIYYGISYTPMPAMSNKSTDRHKDHSRQYNVRIPTPLLDSFNDACKARNLLPAVVMRTLMQGFVDVSGPNAERSVR